MANASEQTPSPEFVTGERAIEYLETVVNSWDFSANDDVENCRFALNVAYWGLDTIEERGRQKDKFLYSHDTLGIDGDDLPHELQWLVANNWQNEMYFMDQNSVLMQAQNEYIENLGFSVDEKEELNNFPTMKGLQAYLDERMKSSTDFRDKSEPRILFIPQIRLQFEPSRVGPMSGWGLNFLVNESGVSVSAFGETDKTWAASRFAIENHDETSKLAEIATKLSILCLKHLSPDKQSYLKRNAIPNEKLIELERRLSGEQTIPIDKDGFSELVRQHGF